MTLRPRQRVRPLLALLAALLLPLALAPRADAYLYWAEDKCHWSGPGEPCVGAIGRANLDGAGVDRGFITGAGVVLGVAVDAQHVYWTNVGASTIRRANVDGTGVDKRFITGARQTRSLAVDADHVYWSRGGRSPGIARADLDGSGVDENFITGVRPGIFGLAVDARHVYWAGNEAISRANLDGSGIEQSFIGGANPFGLAVDARHVYWSDISTGAIGRADLDGTDVDPHFITGLARVQGLAVDTRHIYWTKWGPNTIGRANLDGTGVDRSFVTLGYVAAFGVAVDALTDTHVAGKVKAARAQRQTGNRIVVRVKVKARETLTAKASGKIKVNRAHQLKPKKVELASGEAQALKLRPRKAQAKRIAAALKRGEKVTAHVAVRLTDPAGNSKTAKLRVRLSR